MNKKVNKITNIISPSNEKPLKDYLITIKKIEITEMMIRDTSKTKAIRKVDDFLHNCIANNVNLDRTFDKTPFFSYKAEIIKKDN